MLGRVGRCRTARCSRLLCTVVKRQPGIVGIEEVKAELNVAGSKLGVNDLEDWYRVTADQASQNGASSIIGLHDGSLIGALRSAYPNHGWEPHRFEKVPQRHWDQVANHRLALDSAASALGITSLEQWYNVKRKQLEKLGGASSMVISKYDASLPRALMAAYPEHTWLPWKFDRAPRGYWTSKANRVLYMEWLAQKLGLPTPSSSTLSPKLEGWYEVTSAVFLQNGGAGLLAEFDNSVSSLVVDTFPGHEWLPWRFARAPAGWWSDPSNQRSFFDWAFKQLSLRSMGDWYNVTFGDIRRIGGGGLLNILENNSLSQALQRAYPTHPWNSASWPRLKHRE